MSIPNIQELLLQFDSDLPPFTEFILACFNFVIDYKIILSSSLATTIILLAIIYKYNRWFKYNLNYLLLRLPFIGSILNKIIVSRWLKTLKLTFAAGLPIINSLNLANSACNNVVYAQITRNIKPTIAAGHTLSQALIPHRLLPPLVIQTIATAEDAGALPVMVTMLEKLANIYQQETKQTLTILSTLIQPTIMLILGGIIAGLLIAIYLPILQLGTII